MNNESKSKSVRDGFGEALCEIGEKNKDVVVLTANLGESTRAHLFAQKFPERFFDVGVSEQALVTVASGMANYGKIPFSTSYAVFSPGRTWEQIRTTVALNDVPVKIVGAHGGLGAGPYGATHQGLEDIALMRVLPNMIVVVPCDFEEAKKATFAIAVNGKPSYIRLSREESPEITDKKSKFEIGKANILRYGTDPEVSIVGCGPILSEALKASEELKEKGIEIMVINLHTIKPIDEETIVKAAKATGAVVTLEEHQMAGGMGSAVAEILSNKFPVPIEFVGIDDSFGESGSPSELKQKFGLTAFNIEAAVKKAIGKKQKLG